MSTVHGMRKYYQRLVGEGGWGGGRVLFANFIRWNAYICKKHLKSDELKNRVYVKPNNFAEKSLPNAYTK